MSNYKKGFLEEQEAIYRKIKEEMDESDSLYPIVVKMWERYKEVLEQEE